MTSVTDDSRNSHVRFWIIAVVLALIGLSTLKLR